MKDSALAEPLLHIQQQIEIAAPAKIAWESLLEEIGPDFGASHGQAMNMKLELWPGGRWFRDLGHNVGHLWGHVQVIKPPKLLEICGPLFMSFAAINHVQWRLTEQGSGTLLTLNHRAMGDIPAKDREGMTQGWNAMLESIRKRSAK